MNGKTEECRECGRRLLTRDQLPWPDCHPPMTWEELDAEWNAWRGYFERSQLPTPTSLDTRRAHMDGFYEGMKYARETATRAPTA